MGSKNNVGPRNPRYKELKGLTFGRWTVLEFAGNRKWSCECSCHKRTHQNILANDLKEGRTKSCGCLQREKPSSSISKRETEFSPQQHECVEGLLLSDAGLWRRRAVHTSSVRFQFGSVALPFVQYVQKSLPFPTHLNTRPGYSKRVAGSFKASACRPFFTIASPLDLALLSYDERWYVRSFDDKGVKRVPEDLVLTPTVVLFWFLGDGSTAWIR